MDVWENTTLGNGDTAHELVELFVVADGELRWRGSSQQHPKQPSMSKDGTHALV